MLNDLISDMTRPLHNALKMAGWGAAAVIAAAVALFFFSFAAFVCAQENYGTVDAALLLGAIYLVVACLIVATALVLRRRAIRRQPPPAPSPQWWKDPAIIATGMELVRIIGVRRIIPAAALGAVIVGVLHSTQDKKRRSDAAK